MRTPLTLVLTLALSSIGAEAQDRPQKAEAIYLGGTIVTLNPAQPVTEALAVGGSSIIAIGTEAELRPFYKHGLTRIVDLAGKTLLPAGEGETVGGALQPGDPANLIVVEQIPPALDAVINAATPDSNEDGVPDPNSTGDNLTPAMLDAVSIDPSTVVARIEGGIAVVGGEEYGIPLPRTPE